MAGQERSTTGAGRATVVAVGAGPVNDNGLGPMLTSRATRYLTRPDRTLSLAAEVWGSWFTPKTLALGAPRGNSLSVRQDAWQVGSQLSGILNLLPNAAVQPYVVAGPVLRFDRGNSAVTEQLAAAAPSTQRFVSSAVSLDASFGAGARIRLGDRHLVLDARVHAGAAIHFPITVGLTF
ncbi:MAG: hypothetical protein NW201_06125 [Gemmatimonadales bacterium]|nr:hypothetical protein [Gemmatimonadales bacterium]